MKLSLLLAVLALAAVAVAAMPHDHARDDSEVQVDMSKAALTALQTYVATPDNNFAWEHLEGHDQTGIGFKIQVLNMTSQRWLTDADVSQSIWWHYVVVITPDNLLPAYSNTALMYITGGSQNDDVPTQFDEDVLLAAVMAQSLQTLTVVLFQIPNQPVMFWSEIPTPKKRSEDALIAFAWNHYIEDTSDPEWLPRLPMTKGAVRAMDAVEAFTSQEGMPTISKWLVAGASKRGWTTWTVGVCVPDRVVAIVPMVLDELNFVHNIHHHRRAYGGWSFALKDYWRLNFTSKIDLPQTADMMQIIDPINYYDELASMPKLVLSTGGDEFLLPDDINYFWSMLGGEKHFRLMPNIEHSMATNLSQPLTTIAGFGQMILSNTPRPTYNWTTDPTNGTITLTLDPSTPPASVLLWHAYTIDGNERRDFRLVVLNVTSGGEEYHNVTWVREALPPVSQTDEAWIYEGYVAPPEEGWVGFMIEVNWPAPGPKGTLFRISTAPTILPMTFPYPDCEGAECAGPLV